MKLFLKLAISFVFVAALVLTFATVTSDSANARLLCPPNPCPDVLDGYTLIGPCNGGADGYPCLGWAYQGRGETCHVSALTGL